ncbi:(4Fe-4S)-binding protein [Exiguobacterium sp. s168]
MERYKSTKKGRRYIMKKGYEGKEITVYFDSEVCIHSGHCVRSLPTDRL